ncbi:MAG: putative lipid II flippase FtsW [Gammaproteobacteria bacterium]|nr:putative lipid II flippase FtsW [Gammaproteobacteria bacterium]
MTAAGAIGTPLRALAQPADSVILCLGLALLLVGFVAITSASVEYAAANYGDPLHHSSRHLMYLVLALLAATVAYSVPMGFWFDTGWVWLFIGLVLLLLVLIPGIGREVNGSRRWLALGPATLQASEFARLFLIIYLSGYLQRREEQVRSQWQGFVKPMMVVFAITLLLMVEPDFGATVVTVGTAFGMLFLAGVKLGHFLLVVLGSVMALVILLVSEPYRMQRLTAYTDPWADQFNSGYQLTQSLIAFGRGEWTGVGLGNSVQKLFYLPEAHTDFVFSIWAEETGLIGAVTVIALYLALIYRILWISRKSCQAGDLFGAHICHGVALVFTAQVFINIGVSTGLLPTKGLTLPLISYGGSSLIVCCCMLALVLRVDRERRTGRGKRGR